MSASSAAGDAGEWAEGDLIERLHSQLAADGAARAESAARARRALAARQRSTAHPWLPSVRQRNDIEHTLAVLEKAGDLARRVNGLNIAHVPSPYAWLPEGWAGARLWRMSDAVTLSHHTPPRPPHAGQLGQQTVDMDEMIADFGQNEAWGVWRDRSRPAYAYYAPMLWNMFRDVQWGLRGASAWLGMCGGPCPNLSFHLVAHMRFSDHGRLEVNDCTQSDISFWLQQHSMRESDDAWRRRRAMLCSSATTRRAVYILANDETNDCHEGSVRLLRTPLGAPGSGVSRPGICAA